MKITTAIRICIVSAACLVGVQTSALAAAARVAIIPFQINADQDYSYLQRGIVDMLSSRLSDPTVEVIDPLTTAKVLEEVKDFKDDSKVLMAAAKLKADFAIRGSITILGNSVSIDAKVFDVTGTRPALSFYKQTQGMDEVILQINRLATEINSKIFGRSAPAVKPEPQQSAPSAASGPATKAPPPQQDIHMHPEKLLQGGVIVGPESPSPLVGGQAGASPNPLNPAFVSPAGSVGQGSSFWKSRNFDFLINGVAVGDVNKDGRQETVVVAPHEISILQFAQGRMRKVQKIDTGRFVYNIGVDIGDINADGTPEIFVTSLTILRNVLASRVIEFDGHDFKTIVEKAPWYFRVMDDPVRGKILLGQQQSTGDDPFRKEIVELAWKGAEYLPTGRILPPGRANLLGMAMGDIMNDKNQTVVALNPDDKLRLMQLNGKQVWTGNDYYGGSPVYYSMSGDSRGTPSVNFYLPVRLLVNDLDHNGKYDVLAIRNEESTGRKLAQQRFYGKGRIVSLQWTGLGLGVAWQTREISGRIQDMAVADFDNDGTLEILCAVVSEEGAIIGTDARSSLIAYKLAASS